MMQNNKMCCLLLCVVGLIGSASLRATEDVPYNGGSHPEHAQPGEVWCLITTPPQYKTVSEEVLCKPASCTYETIPAVYKTVCEQVCCKKESTRCIPVPAVYKTETYEVQKCPSRTEWQSVDCDNINVSVDAKEQKGKCVALVTIPAVFETRTREVCVTPASTRTEVIPAEYKTVEKRVCETPESKRRIDIPAVYETRTKEVCVGPERKVWRLTACKAPEGVANCNTCEEKKEKCNPCNTCCEEPTEYMYDGDYRDGVTQRLHNKHHYE